MSNFIPGVGMYFTVTNTRVNHVFARNEWDTGPGTLTKIKSDDRSYYDMTFYCKFSDGNYVVAEVIHGRNMEYYKDPFRLRVDEYAFHLANPEMMKAMGIDHTPDNEEPEVEEADNFFKQWMSKLRELGT